MIIAAITPSQVHNWLIVNTQRFITEKFWLENGIGIIPKGKAPSLLHIVNMSMSGIWIKIQLASSSN